ncbi:molybdate ABC transporter substrate-binding protein [Rhabdobacter roseus]|uniref:Molybdate transport system substrate-binding protein n=1 Tax=Rhabdobacter roseus TaxID=1655419 RepID=A0A840TQA7_9BACT|nr:molybdate ABC transporter substrate-binding protein [Rhabdobacter roseus]MBB5285514.1 molybdate transport system substrate-binding protein [Rhabdobacter roseus]
MNTIKNRVVLFVVLGALWFGASCSRPNENIVVATAANVQFVMQELKAEFERQSDRKLELVVSSSGKLTTQIREGAPFDVFVSADTKYPAEIHRNGGSEQPPRVYAQGTLVLWTMDTTRSGPDLARLTSDAIRKIAIANPRTAPYGEAALEVLQQAGIYEQVKGKLVFGESIAQTSHYITTRSADVGFTALSMVLSPEMKGKGRWIKLDSTTYRPIEQAAILLRHSAASPKREASEAFYNFLFSESAKVIFRKYGYSVDDLP